MARLAQRLDLPVDLLAAAGVPSPQLPPGSTSCRIEVAESSFADVMVRRSSLLLAFWDGSPASAADDAAHLVMRFLGVRLEPSESIEPLQIATAPAELDVGVRLVYWLPALRNAAAASPPGEPGFLLAAGDSF